MKAKKLIATLAMAGVITASGAGAAFAADGSNSTNGQTPAGQVPNGQAARKDGY